MPRALVARARCASWIAGRGRSGASSRVLTLRLVFGAGALGETIVCQQCRRPDVSRTNDRMHSGSVLSGLLIAHARRNAWGLASVLRQSGAHCHATHAERVTVADKASLDAVMHLPRRQSSTQARERARANSGAAKRLGTRCVSSGRPRTEIAASARMSRCRFMCKRSSGTGTGRLQDARRCLPWNCRSCDDLAHEPALRGRPGHSADGGNPAPSGTTFRQAGRIPWGRALCVQGGPGSSRRAGLRLLDRFTGR